MLEPVMWALYAIVLFIAFYLIIVFFEDGAVIPETQEPEEFPTLSLIIPAYNEEDTIQMTIESALEIDYPEDKYEVIVVNDGSTDSTLEKAEEYNEITIVDKENGGKGSALNAGIDESDSELVACVDADSKLAKDSLKRMVAEIGGDAGVASAMKVYRPENMLQRLQWVEYIVGIFTRNIMGLMNGIHVTPGPLSVYRKEKLEEVGKFDEDSLVEDQEICFRFQREHYKIAHASKAEVHTVAPATVKEFIRQRYRWYRGSLETAWENRDMIFNPKYGDFGMFAVPAKWAQTGLSLVVLFLTTYLFVIPMSEFLIQFHRLGFEYFSFSSFSLSQIPSELYWMLISTRFVTMFSILALFTLSAFLAYLAGKHTEENVLEKGLIPLITYLGFFVFINGLLWLIVIFKILLGEERTW